MDEFNTRRQTFLNKMSDNSIAIVIADTEKFRNADSHFPFRQNSNFYYLTGFTEPDAIAVFIPNHSGGEYILFNRPNDPAAERWTGKRAGQPGATKHYQANQSFPIDTFHEKLPALMQNRNQLYYDLGKTPEYDDKIIHIFNDLKSQARRGVQTPHQINDCDALIANMRLIKSSDEINLMRRAAQMSASAHIRAMRACQPGMMEYELEAEILHEFYKNGSRYPAYTSIVGGGANACVLHYIDNNHELKSDDLVLIDAGAEYQYYAADITRTFPVNGKFTQEQRAIYELVLHAQLEGIKQVKPGTPWPRIQEVIVEILTQGMLEFGILKGELSQLIENQDYKAFYMHNSGHWLGLDVHDVGPYKQHDQWTTLAPGMVLTVEPGLYIAGDNPNVDKKWWDIGVRIEDDVLVTENGCEVLSADVPKTVADIENLMQS